MTVNAGSSSLKLALVADGERIADEEIPARAGELDADALRTFADRRFDCSSHRVVHGGPRLPAGTVGEHRGRLALGSPVGLAPLHTKSALAARDVVRALARDRPAIACF